MSKTSDIVIIGGGIWGLSTAWHLKTHDSSLSVTVLERNAELADETTRVSAGQVGQLRTDPLLVGGVGYTLDWLASFHEITGHDPHFTQTGSLHIATNETRSASFVRQMEEASALGVEVVSVDPASMKTLVPGLNTDAIHSAISIPNDGYVQTRETALSLAHACCDLGVSIVTDCAVMNVEPAGDSVSIHTTEETYTCAKVVVAAGPWTASVAESLGVALPVQAIHLQQARTVASPEIHAKQPVLRVPDANAYVRPEHGGYLFGVFNTDPVSLDVPSHTINVSTNQERITALLESLSKTLPSLPTLGIDEYRQGAVTCTPDGGYVIGPLNETPNVFVATGCGARGIAGCGAIGNWLSYWVRTGDSGDDLSPFDPHRFGEKNADRVWVKVASEQTFATYYTLPDVMA